jgi:site-specific DNA recombinase
MAFKSYTRLSDARRERAFQGRLEQLVALGQECGLGEYLGNVQENDVDGSGKPKPASAWKKHLIKLPNGQVQYRVIRPRFADDVIPDLTAGISYVAEDDDRLYRNIPDCIAVTDACQYSGASIYTLSGTLTITNGGDPDERKRAMDLAREAEAYSDSISRHVKRGRKRHQGTFQGGRRRFGFTHDPEADEYEKTLLIIDDEAELIRAAASDILDRDTSLAAIARRWREGGVITVTGTTNWTPRQVKEVITKPAISGLALHNGDLKQGNWTPILDQPIWERLVKTLNAPERRTSSQSNEPRHLASGLALCGNCKDGTTVRATGRVGATFYTCSGGVAHLKRQAKYVDPWIEYNITAWLSRDHTIALMPEPKPGIDTTKLLKEQKEFRKRQAGALEMYRKGLIDREQLEKELAEYKVELTRIDAQLASSAKPDPIPEFRHHGPTRQIWHDLPLERKRDIIRQAVDITILPSALRGRAGFDRNSVTIIVQKTGETLDATQWPEAEGFEAYLAAIGTGKGE